MDLVRIVRHLCTTDWKVRRAFPHRTLAEIENAIRRAEHGHSGEIRFAVEGALDGAPLFRGQSARERAIDVFSQLRVWDTEHNNGVLIYVLLADRDVEIIVDRGIHVRVGSEDWEAICRQMEAHFRAGDFEAGALAGIQAVAARLLEHFPPDGRDANQIPDQPVIL